MASPLPLPSTGITISFVLSHWWTTPKMYFQCYAAVCALCVGYCLCTDWYHLGSDGGKGLLGKWMGNCSSSSSSGRWQSQRLLIVQWDRVWHILALVIAYCAITQNSHSHTLGKPRKKGMRMTTFKDSSNSSSRSPSDLKIHNIYNIADKQKQWQEQQQQKLMLLRFNILSKAVFCLLFCQTLVCLYLYASA